MIINRLIHIEDYERALTKVLGHETFVQLDTKGEQRFIQSAVFLEQNAIPLYAHPLFNEEGQQIDADQFVAEIPTHYRIGKQAERQSRLETLLQIHTLAQIAQKAMRNILNRNTDIAQDWHSIVLPEHLQIPVMQERYATSYRIGSLQQSTFERMQKFMNS
jgi:hypothetical protein